MHIDTYTPDHAADDAQRDAVASFLFKHLDQFGDPEEHIRRPSTTPWTRGGRLRDRRAERRGIIGAVVVNDTGMGGTSPSTSWSTSPWTAPARPGRGQALMREAIGRLGRHRPAREPDNPAKLFYESLGFTNKYLKCASPNERGPGGTTAFRRDLHTHPEVSGEEYATATRVLTGCAPAPGRPPGGTGGTGILATFGSDGTVRRCSCAVSWTPCPSGR